MKNIFAATLAGAFALAVSTAQCQHVTEHAKMTQEALTVSGRRELLIDDYLIDEMDKLEFRLHYPVELPADSSKPCGAYVTVLQDKAGYKMYYRGFDGVYAGNRYNGNPGEYTGIAESSNGLLWTEPRLDFYKDEPVPPNTLFYHFNGFTHNFTPFYDRNPDCPPQERYKALAGVRETKGLFAFHSADGIHWCHYNESKPVIEYNPENFGGHLLDSQNVAFYSEYEKCYVMYFRVWKTSDGREKLRTFAKTVSKDFLHWSEAELLNPNLPGEHLYVSTFAPYARAPQYYVGVATRFFASRGAATDMTLLFSRHGQGVQRPFPGAWITPGLDPERWGNRMNYMAWGIVQASPEEMVLYHGHKKILYKLRTDGFISLSAGIMEGTFLTRPLELDSCKLELNLATSAGGGLEIEICDKAGKPIPGYSFGDFQLFYGDRISFIPKWNGKMANELPAGIYRIRVRMKECDLYSIGF